MRQIIMGAALAIGLCGGAWAQSTSPAMATHQQKELARGEPARWMKDDRTVTAQMATKRKEIGAALNEALNDCKSAAKNERTACVKQARATYRQDMGKVKDLVAQSNSMGGVHETSGPSE